MRSAAKALDFSFSPKPSRRIAARIRPEDTDGSGIRFQWQPRSEPSEIILHVQLLDAMTAHEQEALGELGVNLIHGAFYLHEHPSN